MESKHYLSQIILTTLIAAAHGVLAQTSTLTGHIEGIGKQPIMFIYDLNGKQQRDTVLAINDRFTYLPRPSDDGKILLRIRSPRFTSFWYEPSDIIVTGNDAMPYKLTFKGGPENEILNQYNESIDWKELSEEQQKKQSFQFIRDHSDSRTAAEVLYRQLFGTAEYDEIYEKLWETLSPSIQASYFGKKAAEKIEILKTQPIAGRIAPNFAVPDTAGVDVSLNDFKGKYVLLDFWGHWCGPCIKSFPKVKALHEKYGNKLAVVGIAMEYADDKDQWLAAIRKHKANWTQLSELNGDKGVDFQYNIIGYPTYLLLDKEGVVIERSLGLEAIEKKLEEIGTL